MGRMAGPSEPTIAALLIEDDDRLAQLLTEYLSGHGVVVAREADGLRGQREALAHRWDVILLDLMLPGRDGLAICREIRSRSDVPIIILTARGEEADRVLGLELGADDYLAKPFSPRELLARIRALLRRTRGQAGPSTRPIEVGPLRIDPGAHVATLDGKELELTSYEFNLLRVFAERAGRVLTREQLLDLVKGSAEEAFDRSIDVHVSRLRQKLGDDARHPRWLKTVRGVGYLFAAAGDEER